jgi:hypothetical protein
MALVGKSCDMEVDGSDSESCPVLDCGVRSVVTATAALYSGFLGYDTVQSGRLLPTFRRNLLHRSSGQLLLSG